MWKEQRCNVFNAITGKLVSDVVDFRFSELFFFVLPIMPLLFSQKSHCHSFLFCRESVISVSYSGLPQSYNQNTEQDTLPLLYKATKGSKSLGKYDTLLLTWWCANATLHQFYNTYFKLLSHRLLLCWFMYWHIMNCFRRTSVWINSIYILRFFHIPKRTSLLRIKIGTFAVLS